MKGSRRVGTWVGAGIFTVLAVCLLVGLPLWFIGLNNFHPGAEDVVYPPGQVRHVGIYPVQVCLIAVFAVSGALFGMMFSPDVSPAGRVPSTARGTFFGSLLLMIGLIVLVLPSLL